MCIALLSTVHPGYPYILLSNRDEFLDRPTAQAEWWTAPDTHVLGGRDLQRKEHGTWLAITRQGRLAVLTNFREEGAEKNHEKSRGGIVNAFLTAPPDARETPLEFAGRLIDEVGVNDVGGFSLLFGELRASEGVDGKRPGLSILSNRSASAETLVQVGTTAGEVHGLSNTHFEDHSWPKVISGKELLSKAVDDSVRGGLPQDQMIERFFEVLSVDTLPRRQEGEEWVAYARQLRKSIFIPSFKGQALEKSSAEQLAASSTMENGAVGTADGQDGYGTQKQTVVLVDRAGKVTFVERTLFDEHGRVVKGDSRERKFEFVIEGWESSSS